MIVSTPRDSAEHSCKSIFLAGPTVRDSAETTPWRVEAIKLLQSFPGVVFVPEPMEGDYQHQISWEDRRLHEATVILFWVPRDLITLPAFTTNIEFGYWMNHPSKKPIVLGYPVGAPKLRYLHTKADKYGIPVFHTLEETLLKAVSISVLS